MLVDREAILQEGILQFGPAGIAGAHQYEDAFAFFVGDLDERLDGIAAHIGRDGYRIGPFEIIHFAEAGIAQGASGVAFGGVADVGAFGVVDDDQAMGGGFLHDGPEGFDAIPVILFEKRGVNFHDGHMGRDDFEHLVAELQNRIHPGLQIAVIAIGTAGTQIPPPGNRRGYRLIDGIQPHAQRSALGLNRRQQPIRKIRHSNSLKSSHFNPAARFYGEGGLATIGLGGLRRDCEPGLAFLEQRGVTAVERASRRWLIR